MSVLEEPEQLWLSFLGWTGAAFTAAGAGEPAMLRDTDPVHTLLSLAISLKSWGHMRPRSPGVGTSWGSAWLCVLQLSSWGGRTEPAPRSHCSWGSWRGCSICFSSHGSGRCGFLPVLMVP